MSSFYVSIGLYRLLHDYSTAEVRRAYEWVSEHFAGDEEYRAVKGALINRLQERFEKFLRTCRTQRGEVRFEVLIAFRNDSRSFYGPAAPSAER
jgi:hypothetical protein